MAKENLWRPQDGSHFPLATRQQPHRPRLARAKQRIAHALHKTESQMATRRRRRLLALLRRPYTRIDISGQLSRTANQKASQNGVDFPSGPQFPPTASAPNLSAALVHPPLLKNGAFRKRMMLWQNCGQVPSSQKGG